MFAWVLETVKFCKEVGMEGGQLGSWAAKQLREAVLCVKKLQYVVICLAAEPLSCLAAPLNFAHQIVFCSPGYSHQLNITGNNMLVGLNIYNPVNFRRVKLGAGNDFALV